MNYPEGPKTEADRYSDYNGKRQGNRVVSLGEKPYFDPNSKSRREALGQQAN